MPLLFTLCFVLNPADGEVAVTPFSSTPVGVTVWCGAGCSNGGLVVGSSSDLCFMAYLSCGLAHLIFTVSFSYFGEIYTEKTGVLVCVSLWKPV